MNILKFYKTLKGLFKSSCGELMDPKECKALHMCDQSIVFEAIDNDLWQYSNVIVAYKGLRYIVYIYQLNDFTNPHPSELEIKTNQDTIITDLKGMTNLLYFLSRLFNNRACVFGSLKEDGCESLCCG